MNLIKLVFGVTFGMALLVVFAYYLLIGIGINAIVDEVDDTEALKTELVGEKVIFNNDTLTITEFHYNPTGSKISAVDNDKNVVKIDAAFAKKNLLK